MSIGTALTAIKSANSALNTLIGVRFYPDAFPQEFDLPAVCYQVVSTLPSLAMTPVMVNNRYRVQLDGYAATPVLRSSLRNAMLNAFFGFSGTIGGEAVRSILIDTERMSVEQLNTEAEAYRVSMDFFVDL
jgi:hypothetical protein